MDPGNLFRYLSIFSRWRALILAVPLLAALVLSGVYLATPRYYRATARLLYNPTHIKLTVASDEQAYIYGWNRLKSLNTHLELLQSLPVMQRVAENLPTHLSLSQIHDGLSIGLSKTAGNATDIIDVTFRSTKQELCMQVVNTLCSVYMQFLRETYDKQHANVMQSYDRNIERLTADLNARLDTLSAFRRSNRMVSIENHESAISGQVALIHQTMQKTNQQIHELDQRIALLRTNLGTQAETVLEQVTLENPYLKLLQEKQLELRSLSASLTPVHPRMLSLKRQIEALEQSARSEVRKVPASETVVVNPMHRALAQDIADLTIDRSVLVTRKDALEAIAAQLDRSRAALPRMEQENRSLSREIDMLTEALSGLKFNRISAKVGGDTFESVVTVLEQPEEAMLEPHPMKTSDFLSGIFGALIAALFLAVLFDRLRRGIKNLDSFETDTSCHLLGIIPHTTTHQGLVAFEDTMPDIRLEPYRNLRVRLRHQMDSTGSQIIMIASPCQFIDTSMLVMNLARAFAITGKEVLVVGANMRRSNLHAYCLDYAGVGLTALIVEQADIYRTIHSTNWPHLFILPPGRTAHHPSELLGDKRVREVFGWSRRAADIILVDAPPVLECSDALALAPAVDSCLLAVRWHRSPVKAVQEARRQLESISCPVIGCVLDGIPPNRDYYQYLYGVYRHRVEKYTYERRPPETATQEVVDAGNGSFTTADRAE